MKVRVLNGTPAGEDLCKTCDEAFIYQYDDGRETRICTAFSFTQQKVHLTRRVVKCNHYREKDAKTPADYEKTAWILKPKEGRRAGFTPYTKLSEDEQTEIAFEMDTKLGGRGNG
jgi:hypothetical protein